MKVLVASRAKVVRLRSGTSTLSLTTFAQGDGVFVEIDETHVRRFHDSITLKIESGEFVQTIEDFSKEPLLCEFKDLDVVIPNVYETDGDGNPILEKSSSSRPRYTREELETDPSLIPNIHDVDPEGVPIVFRP